MTFTIPNMKELTDSTSKLCATYQTERSDMDGQRFFASFRSSTINSERLNDANCIEKIAKSISRSKFKWESIDPTFANKNYAREIAPFLREVISGALLLELIKITTSYKRGEAYVKTGTALGKIILDLFNIDKLSDVPTEQMHKCLSNFKHFLEVTNEPKVDEQNKPIPLTQWHASIENSALIKQVNEELENYSVNALTI